MRKVSTSIFHLRLPRLAAMLLLPPFILVLLWNDSQAYTPGGLEDCGPSFRAEQIRLTEVTGSGPALERREEWLQSYFWVSYGDQRHEVGDLSLAIDGRNLNFREVKK
jgi:hypothetical protein